MKSMAQREVTRTGSCIARRASRLMTRRRSALLSCSVSLSSSGSISGSRPVALSNFTACRLSVTWVSRDFRNLVCLAPALPDMLTSLCSPPRVMLAATADADRDRYRDRERQPEVDEAFDQMPTDLGYVFEGGGGALGFGCERVCGATGSQSCEVAPARGHQGLKHLEPQIGGDPGHRVTDLAFGEEDDATLRSRTRSR